MGAHIDVSALRGAASRFDAAADALSRIADTRATFGAATAGRAHVAHGEAVRMGVDRLSDDIRTWSRADAETASVLRTSADRYAESEQRAAGGLG
jgi:hypothetical protein